MGASNAIETEPSPTCPVCRSPGLPKFEEMVDRVFGAPGRWTMKQCTTASCGTLWLDPRPTPQDIGKAYQTYYTHGVESKGTVLKRTIRALAREHAAVRYGFASSHLPWPGRFVATAAAALYPGLRDHLDLLVRYLPSTAFGSGRLLDVGCGDGEALEILRDLGWKVQGVEVDPQAVAAALSRSLNVQHGTLHEVAFEQDTFDAVTSSHVIEHVHDPREFLAESRRILRSGGVLIAVTPNATAWSILRYGVNSLNLDPPRHLALFSTDSLRRLAESVGLREVRVVTSARAVALAEIASSKLRDYDIYRWGEWPGLPTWVRAQAMQILVSSSMKLGRVQGEELVLVATK